MRFVNTLCLSFALTLGMYNVVGGDDRLRLSDICRLKGQEENTLQGLGLVVGLNGTGDDAVLPTTRALAQMLKNMGGNIAQDGLGVPDLKEIEDTGNVALVLVTANIPGAGVQQGDKLNCTVSAISAKSLEGGRLMQSFLLGPRADVPVVYAIADGNISIPDPTVATAGVVYGGCKMEATIHNQFVHENFITLILDRDVASFSTAIDVQDAINSLNQTGLSQGSSGSDSVIIAKAIDQLHVKVAVPDAYREQPVQFVSLVLDLPLPHLKKNKRVVINEREGVIVIGEDILINPVAINHKNLSIEARPGAGRFVEVDPESPAQPRPKLKNLVDALNALKVPTEDVIAIIRTLKRNGDLYGEVIMQ